MTAVSPRVLVLERQVSELQGFNLQLSDMLDQIAVALKGLPEPGKMHSWEDLVDVARGLREDYEALLTHPSPQQGSRPSPSADS